LAVYPSSWQGGICDILPAGDRPFAYCPAFFGTMNRSSSGPADIAYSGGKPDVRYAPLR
jgi:hypothetical protein